MLEDKIKKFLAVGSDDGSGDGLGYGDAFCSGYGFYLDDDFGDGSGDGLNDYTGYGSGLGYNNGSGHGYGDNHGVQVINNNNVYMVDSISTIFTYIRKNIAQGFIVKNDLSFEPCYIVKENNHFAHGDTLKDAFMSLHEKLYDYSTEEERIEAFMKQFPEYDVKYDNMDLFVYHHVLTSSCRMGREAFMSNKGLSLDGKTSVREFVKLTQDAYGGDIIKKLPEAYGIK